MKSYIPKTWLKNKIFQQFSYPKDMDEEMIPLMDVLNSIPGVRTMYSCCGHDYDNMMYFVINFTSDYARELVAYEVFDKSGDFVNISEDYEAIMFDCKVPELKVSFYVKPKTRSKKERIRLYKKWIKALVEYLPRKHW